MRLIGVIDLAAGRAVRARAGRRETYQPVESFGGEPIASGDALVLARAYLERAGLGELYIADLGAITAAALADRPPGDRIGGRTPWRKSVAAPGAAMRQAGKARQPRMFEVIERDGAAPRAARAVGSQEAAIAAVATLEVPVWLDSGVSSPDRACHALALGASYVIVGLETLPSYDALKRMCAAVGGERVAFSLDLRDGRPILASHAIARAEPPHLLAARAVDMGVGAVIVLDLARVGTGMGVDLTVVERVRASTPRVTLLAGGGVQGLADLRRLSDAGCDGALVATALQTGALQAADVVEARDYRSVSQGADD